ncbi:MAG: hypothetical protein IJL18_09225 [Synergistaceae bacterium]|nr:hypothetical protein [Synergistaceae bacterium]MBR0279574.1 hypothetical protein [Synergistaceae bacterium]
MAQILLILLVLCIGLYIDFEINSYQDADGTKHFRFNVSVKTSGFMG